MASTTVVVFDFDKTIIDCDSDNWVIDGLGGTEHFEELLKIMPWNSAMDRMMMELHSQGRTIEEMTASLQSAPLPANTISAIKTAYALGCDLRIVSDANMFFIETILKHHGLVSYFSEINTNPGFVDEEGRLRILPYHDFSTSSHGCSLCPPNMCKSKILERIRESSMAEGRKQFIYLGDGKGDYCPSLALSEGDYVMPRENYPLWELICESPAAIRAEIHQWSNAEELDNTLLQLIEAAEVVAGGHGNAAAAAAANQMISADCKSQMAPLSSHDALPKALTVPH